MKYSQIGDDRVSVIGLGTWQYGAKMEWGWKDSQLEEAIRIIQRALDLGINVIDTAEAYSRGTSERIVGEAIVDRREEVFLATKHNPLLPPFPGRILKTAAASLERLQTDHVELYQMHWSNPILPLKMQMKGMKALCDAGQVKHIGVSNFSLSRWQKAEQALGGPVASNQVQYNLLQRKAEKLLPWAQQNGRIVIAYSPLAQGLLSGKYTAANAPGGFRKINTLFTPANIQAAQSVLKVLSEVGQKYDASPGQIALAWLVYHPNVIAIPGAKTIEQLEQNAAAGDIELAEEDFVRLTEASDAFHKSSLRSIPQMIVRFFRSQPSGGVPSVLRNGDSVAG